MAKQIVPKFKISINGIVDPIMHGYVTEVVVDQNIYMPSMFTITLEEKPNMVGLLKFVDNVIVFRLGAPVRISALVFNRKTQLPTENQLISGEITAIEPIFSEGGKIRFRIRGYDLAHRLTLGKKTRAFGGTSPAPTVTDTQIVNSIAAQNGMIARVDPLSITYNYVLQHNQSDWDFLWSRARMLGFELYVVGKILNFVKAGKARILKPTALKWGENLQRFEPRIVAAGAVTKVTVQGWDPKKQSKVKGTSSMFLGNDIAKIPGALLPGSKTIMLAYSSRAEDFISSPMATSSGTADKLAAARMAEHESQFVRASGEAEGHPGIIAGSNIFISRVGARFTGKYYVTEARHILRGGDYHVQFQVAGRTPHTMRYLLMGNDVSSANDKINGVVVGVVTNNNDIETLGRVKVKFPWMNSAVGELETGWARIAMPGAGAERGILFIPEVNDEVLVAFDQGDINFPFIVGSLWSNKKKPPKAPGGQAVLGGKVNQRIFRSRTGHIIMLDDTRGKEKILIQDKSGKSSIEIDSSKRSMTIKSEGDLTIDVGGKLIIKSKLDLSVDGQTKIDIQAKTGAVMKVAANELNLQPSGAALKGAKLDLQGQAQTTLQGAQTSVKGSAMVEIQGGLVKIN
ncbi:MAG: VgrG-related protein [Chloroflexota bacterium]